MKKINTKILNGLLKTTVAVCLSCACMTSKADGTLTLEELRALLKEEERKTGECLKAIEGKIKEINDLGVSNEKCEGLVKEVLKDLSRIGGVQKVWYDRDGAPDFIKTFGHGIDGDLYWRIDFAGFQRWGYMEEHFSDLPSDLDGISEAITTEALKERGLTDAETELLKEASIREITFDSILSSSFFDENSRTKGKEWYSDRKKLEEAIDAYTENVTILRYISVAFLNCLPEVDYTYDEKSQKKTMIVRRKPNLKSPKHLIYKLSGSSLEERRGLLKKALKGLLNYKNGKEKIILLLLLDEKTSPEYRLEWVDGSRAAYYRDFNRIQFIFNDERDRKFLSHEIGHYLQVHLVMRQTFKDYQNAFAEKLLLLEYQFKDGEQTFSVPKALNSLFKNFDRRAEEMPQILTGRDLFMRWQLASRWKYLCEISNILGIYFGSDCGKIYVCALSDICEQKRIRYGHEYDGSVYKNFRKTEGHRFEDTKTRTVFENIVKEAALRQPDKGALKLLCKLHKCPFAEIVNFFDAKSDEDRVKFETAYNDFVFSVWP